MMSKSVVVGMSGGVDSSVAAYLLKEQGYQISGAFMKNWEEDHDDPDYPCTALDDMRDALNVCEQLGIELDAQNFSKEYKDRVFKYFLQEYEAGRTPNPDILCNREIKFKAFLEYALQQGADKMATGHYARIDEIDGRYRLLRGKDDNKDQTYFLYTLGQYALSKSLFPVGELEKPKVRQLAEQAGFENHGKKDSTGICFIGERNFRPFLQRYLFSKPGEIHSPEGDYLGEHRGAIFYTLGQRGGLGIGGKQNSDGSPWYVVAKDLSRNIITAAQGHDHPLLFSQSLRAIDMHWVSGQAPKAPYTCIAKVRHRQADQVCTIDYCDEQTCHVTFAQPQRAVTPGQSIVFYQGEECLGGAIIDQTKQQNDAWHTP